MGTGMIDNWLDKVELSNPNRLMSHFSPATCISSYLFAYIMTQTKAMCSMLNELPMKNHAESRS